MITKHDFGIKQYKWTDRGTVMMVKITTYVSGSVVFVEVLWPVGLYYDTWRTERRGCISYRNLSLYLQTQTAQHITI